MSEVIDNIQTPDLSTSFDILKQDIFANLNCIQIGTIQSFNATKQTASIKLVAKKILETKTDGTRVLQDRPLLLECPVVVLFGGNSLITLPIQVGDDCLVFFNDRQIDEWFFTGQPQAPSVNRSHDLADAIALVGLRSLQKSIAGYLTDGIRIAFNNSSKIDLKNNLIDSIATNFNHLGNFNVTGNLSVTQNLSILGLVKGNGAGNLVLDANVSQSSGRSFSAGNGATGTYNIVNVVNGIVTGGS